MLEDSCNIYKFAREIYFVSIFILHIEWALINWFSARNLCSSLPMVRINPLLSTHVRYATTCPFNSLGHKHDAKL